MAPSHLSSAASTAKEPREHGSSAGSLSIAFCPSHRFLLPPPLLFLLLLLLLLLSCIPCVDAAWECSTFRAQREELFPNTQTHRSDYGNESEAEHIAGIVSGANHSTECDSQTIVSGGVLAAANADECNQRCVTKAADSETAGCCYFSSSACQYRSGNPVASQDRSLGRQAARCRFVPDCVIPQATGAYAGMVAAVTSGVSRAKSYGSIGAWRALPGNNAMVLTCKGRCNSSASWECCEDRQQRCTPSSSFSGARHSAYNAAKPVCQQSDAVLKDPIVGSAGIPSTACSTANGFAVCRTLGDRCMPASQCPSAAAGTGIDGSVPPDFGRTLPSGSALEVTCAATHVRVPSTSSYTTSFVCPAVLGAAGFTQPTLRCTPRDCALQAYEGGTAIFSLTGALGRDAVLARRERGVVVKIGLARRRECAMAGAAAHGVTFHASGHIILNRICTSSSSGHILERPRGVLLRCIARVHREGPLLVLVQRAALADATARTEPAG